MVGFCRDGHICDDCTKLSTSVGLAQVCPINLAHGLAWITDSVLIWDMNDNGQRGEA